MATPLADIEGHDYRLDHVTERDNLRHGMIANAILAAVLQAFSAYEAQVAHYEDTIAKIPIEHALSAGANYLAIAALIATASLAAIRIFHRDN